MKSNLTCRLCPVKFEDEKSLKRHYRGCHPGHFPFQCPKCPAEFDTISVRATHLATHVDSDQDFQCFVCSIKFPTYKELYFHYSHDHVGKLDMICKYCNKIFPTSAALEEHIRVHKIGRRFTCIFCPKSFYNSQSLSVHMKKHTNKKLYKCKVCHRAFLDSTAVFQHMLFHASALVAEQPFKCCICFMGFTQKSGLKTHIGNNHSEHSSCPVCGETPEDVPEMVFHILSHSIRISKNSMSKAETIWMKKSGIKRETDQGSPLPKLRSQKRMSIDDTRSDGRITKQKLREKEIKLEPVEELPKYNTRLVIKREAQADIDLGNAQEESCSKSKQKQSRLRKPSIKDNWSTDIGSSQNPTRKSVPHCNVITKEENTSEAVCQLTNRTSNSVTRRQSKLNNVKELPNFDARSGNVCFHSFGMVTNKKVFLDKNSVPKSRVKVSTNKICKNDPMLKDNVKMEIVISENKTRKTEPDQLLKTKSSKDNLIKPNLLSLNDLSEPSVKRTLSPRNQLFSMRTRCIKSRTNQHNLTVEEVENIEGDDNGKETYSKGKIEKISGKTELALKGKFSNAKPLRRSSRVVINNHNLLVKEEIKSNSNKSCINQSSESHLIKKKTSMNSVVGTYGISVKSSDSVSENGDLPKKERSMSFICVTNKVKPQNKLVKCSLEKNSLSSREINSDTENSLKSNSRDLMLSERMTEKAENLHGHKCKQDLINVQKRGTKSVKEKVINVESNYKRSNVKTKTVKNKTRYTSEISCYSLSKSFERSLSEAAVKSSHNVFENKVCEATFESFKKDFETDAPCISSPAKCVIEDFERASVNSCTDDNENSASDSEMKTHSESSTPYIKEAKYFGPSLNPTTYSCTTCMLDFSSHHALLQHTTFHIF